MTLVRLSKNNIFKLCIIFVILLSILFSRNVYGTSYKYSMAEDILNEQSDIMDRLQSIDEHIGPLLIEMEEKKNYVELSGDAEAQQEYAAIQDVVFSELEEKKASGKLTDEDYYEMVALADQYIALGSEFYSLVPDDELSSFWARNDITSEIPDNGSSMGVVYMAQNGKTEWGDLPFGGGTIASSGSSITSLAMVVSYFNSGSDPSGWIYPSDLWNRIKQIRNGYNYYYSGATQTWDIYEDVAKWYGIGCEAISSRSVESAIADGKPVIMACGPGEFAYKGNIIVITGVDNEGYYHVNDPNGDHVYKSYIQYPLDTLLSEGIGWWAFSASEPTVRYDDYDGGDITDSYGNMLDWEYDASSTVEDFERISDLVDLQYREYGWTSDEDDEEEDPVTYGTLTMTMSAGLAPSGDILVRLWNNDTAKEEDVWLYQSEGWQSSVILETGDYMFLVAVSRPEEETQAEFYHAPDWNFTISQDTDTNLTLSAGAHWIKAKDIAAIGETENGKAEDIAAIGETDNGEYLCSYSSDRLITDADLAAIRASDYGTLPVGRSLEQMIINEIYARHGYQFSTPEIQAYFEQKDWYNSIGSYQSDMDIVAGQLSSIEKQNVDFLASK